MADLAARHRRAADRVEAAVLGVLRSGHYVGGPLVARLEAEVSALFGRRYAVGVGSGTDALVLALRALGVGPGDEVVVPAVTFFATAGAVLVLGARPVVVDVLPDRPLMDPDAARRAVGRRTRAVVPVHLFGAAAPHPDVPVPVLDDAAQAAGGTPPRGQGEAVALSFYPTKVLGGAGEGGMVLTDDAGLAERVRRLGNHGLAGPHLHERVGGAVGINSRLDAIQAAVLLEGVKDLAARVARRRAIAERYDAAFGDLAVPRDPGSPVSAYVIRHPRRDALAGALAARGIDSAVYYPRPLGAQPALGRSAPAPNAERFCREALALPCHAAMDDEAVAAVIAAVREAA